MKKYPYCLYVFKSTFNAGPDLLKTIRRAKPEDTDWYKKTQIADPRSSITRSIGSKTKASRCSCLRSSF